MILFHTTSPEYAVAIVRDGFRIVPGIISGDDCANFYVGRLMAQPENTGCTMKFEWTGDPAQDFAGHYFNEMKPNILYRQIVLGRFALRPGTETGLKFLQVDFDKDAPASKSNYRKEKCEFARAAGRTIPVGYHVGTAQESARKPGLFKIMINRLVGCCSLPAKNR